MNSLEQEARRYLEGLRAATVQRRGAFYSLGSSEALRDLTTQGEKVLGAVTAEGNRTWRAPTAWHAAAWLLNAAAGVAQGKAIHPPQPDLEPSTVEGALLFRGQRDAAWAITPSIARAKDVPKSELALSAWVLANHDLIAFEEMPRMPESAHIAAAQHYGLPTPFVDFTVDPFIATAFACLGALEAGSLEVVVYWLPFAEAVTLGASVVLPPPWVLRLYEQRGLFIDTSNLSGRSLRTACCRIVFPPSESFLSPQNAFAPAELLPSDRWYERAIKWATEPAVEQLAHALEEEVESSEPDPDGNVTVEASRLGTKLAENLRRYAGEPPFSFDVLFPARLVRWTGLLAEMLDWLALTERDGNFIVDCHPLVVMRGQNRSIFSIVMQSLQLLKSRPELGEISTAGLGAYADAFTTCFEDDSA